MSFNLDLLSTLLSCLESICNVNIESIYSFIIALVILCVICLVVCSSLSQDKSSESRVNITMNYNIYCNGYMDMPEDEFNEVIERRVKLKKQIESKINKEK